MAFTGAVKNRDGLLRTADSWTLFPDGIGEVGPTSRQCFCELSKRNDYFQSLLQK
jgi:sigma54-dependent transcription regulator